MLQADLCHTNFANLASSEDPTLIKKANTVGADKNRRRRRKPEDAEQEILDAAEGFLREFPYRKMTVDDIMSRTGLSRPSFYEYFRDRSHLVIKLSERMDARNRALSSQWFTGNNPVEDLRHSTRELVDMYVTNGHLLRALLDAAHNDEAVETNYRERFDKVIASTAQRISEFIASGITRLDGLDPAEIAAALLWMNERYTVEKLGRHDQSADPELVTNTLVAIWQRVLHGSSR